MAMAQSSNKSMFVNAVVLLKAESLAFAQKKQSVQALPFAIWVSDIMDENIESLFDHFSDYGELTCISKHGYPSVKIFEGPTRSAMINFVDYKNAKMAVEACISRKIVFGTSDEFRLFAHAEEHCNTKFVDHMNQIFNAEPDRSVPFEYAERLATKIGYPTVNRWQEVLAQSKCSFKIDTARRQICLDTGACARHVQVFTGRQDQILDLNHTFPVIISSFEPASVATQPAMQRSYLEASAKGRLSDGEIFAAPSESSSHSIINSTSDTGWCFESTSPTSISNANAEHF
jgi:hypothetical protein